MTFAKIIGQRAAVQMLQRTLASGRLPHAMLFHGPDGVGKGTVARALAATLLCETGGVDACGRCSACAKVAVGAHPDLLVVRRLPKKISEAGPMNDPRAGRDAIEDEDLSPFIRIFQIRQLAEHAAFAPREGRRRFFLVDPADRMNAESQNALLKTLEEPPGRSVLVLSSSRPHVLLTTVRSRCLAVGFSAVATAELAPRLQERGLSREEAIARAALSGGRPGRALDLDLEALRARRDEVLEDLLSLARSPAALAELPRMTAAIVGGDEEAFMEGLELMEGLLRDCARASSGAAPEILAHADRCEVLAELGRELGPERAARMIEAVERLRADLRLNLNKTLVAEAMLAAAAGAPLP